MNFIVLQENQLEQIVSSIKDIKETLERKETENISDSYIESKQIPKLLGISQKTWQTYRDNGNIPFIQFGSKIWVKRSDLDSFMNSHYIKK